MDAVFLVCAALGGTLLVCQLALTLLGLGGHDGDLDGGHGGDHAGGHDVDTEADTHAGHSADHPAHLAPATGLGVWLFGMLSFRAIVAGTAFLGLAGLAARSAEARWPIALLVALGAGFAASLTVSGVMRTLMRLRASGNVQMERALGCEATVYLRVPPHHSGVGKIQINLQNRTMEYLATTAGDELPTGSRVLVVDIVDAQTVAVESAALLT